MNATAEVEVKFKLNGTGFVPVPTLCQRHKMAERDVNEEEEAIRDYFSELKGLSYSDILALLDKYHGIRVSIGTLTLKRRTLKKYRLERRDVEYDMDSVRHKIRSLLDGPDCMGGYRHIWHTLKMQRVSVPRSTVEALLRELDPKGEAERRTQRLRRRAYRNSGPNKHL